jgi:small subunit ribosomal protein S3Ae
VKLRSTCDLKELVAKLPEVVGKEIEKATQGIHPLQNACIRKVKILKAPKFDLMKLMEVSNRHPGMAMLKFEQGEICWSADVGVAVRVFSCEYGAPC